MPRIMITMVADVEDLAGFWPNDPPGVTQHNAYALLSAVKHRLLMRLLENQAATDVDVVTKNAVDRSLRDDLQLAERLLASIRIEVT